MADPTKDEEDYVRSLINDHWLEVWEQTTMFRSDSEAHAIGCLITEVRRLRRVASRSWWKCLWAKE